MGQIKTKSLGYILLRPILGFIYKIYYNPKIVNKSVIPKTGPIIIVGNHLHIMDQCNVIISTKRVIHYMAKKEYFDGHFAWFFKITGCISVNRSVKDSKATNTAIDILNKGGAIGLFPEGTRNKTDKLLLPFKYGAVSMAKKTNATIVPFGITGNYKFRSKDLKVVFGKPFKVDDLSIEEANKKLESVIEKLLTKGVDNEK